MSKTQGQRLTIILETSQTSAMIASLNASMSGRCSRWMVKLISLFGLASPALNPCSGRTSASHNASQTKADQPNSVFLPTVIPRRRRKMDLREPWYLYKETRVSLEPSSPATIVTIKLPTTGSQRRGFITSKSNGDSFAEEERAYRVKNLATTSSIYHRKHHSSPRSFLWRVLERGDVLSIRAVDVCKEEKAPDANLILQIHFPRPLRPNCIAFADPENHDALCVFALDEASNLNYLALRPDVFRKRSATEQGLGEAFRPYLSSSFSFKTPHRLIALNADEFVVTLIDGGIIAFRREKHNDTLTWKESLHNPVSFVQGLRSFLPFQGSQTVKYAGTNMEITAAASAAITTLDMNDTPYLLTVCLDHRMRIWNLTNGMIVAANDILGLQRDAHEIGKWTIDPSQGNLVRILRLEQGSCLCVTFSPVGAGAFRFWKVSAQGGNVAVEPYFEPQHALIPPPPSTDVWILADFGISRTERNDISLWILWKNNFVYRVTKLDCRADTIDRAWGNDWASVFADSAVHMAQSSSASDATAPTEKWLQLIFHPGRFSRAVIETALAMYERGMGSQKDSARNNKGLAEAICSVLGSNTTLEKSSAGGMDHEQFRSSSEAQWRRFYRLLIELDKQRNEALSLTVDAETGLSWIICADSIAAVRDCSALDLVYHNLSSPSPDNRDVSRILTAGQRFFENFSDQMVQLCEAALRSELFEKSTKTDPERLQFFSDKSAFWRQVTDDDCAQVTDLLGEKFKAVDIDLYQKVFSLIRSPEDSFNRNIRHPFTQFGQKLVIRGIQDTTEQRWQVLFSQLILLVHMEFEFDEEADALHRRFEVGLVYRQLVEGLQRLKLIKWLAKSEFSVALSKSERSSLTGSPASSRRGLPEDSQIVTCLEASLGHLLGLGELPDGALSTHITDLVVDACAADSSIELDPAMIQCMLLKRERPDLAIEIGSFANAEPFSTYVQGRTFLALRDYETAAAYFRQASVGLSKFRHLGVHLF
jgi:nuclear pore complex protein Nup160